MSLYVLILNSDNPRGINNLQPSEAVTNRRFLMSRRHSTVYPQNQAQGRRVGSWPQVLHATGHTHVSHTLKSGFGEIRLVPFRISTQTPMIVSPFDRSQTRKKTKGRQRRRQERR
jgi:hypothetical protein